MTTMGAVLERKTIMIRQLCALLVGIGLAACSSNALNVGETSGVTIEGITGTFCGKQVTRMEDCKGDEILYVTIAETSGPVRYSGEVCEAFQKDCVPLTFTEVVASPPSAKASFEGKSDKPKINASLFTSTDKKTIRIKWEATDIYPARDAILYRVGDIGGSTPKLVEGLTGEWCGKQVARAVDCLGDEVFYMSIAEAANAVGYSGSICEAFNKDCVPLTITAAVVTPARAQFEYDLPKGKKTGRAVPSADKKTLDVTIDASAGDPRIEKRLFRVGT